MLPFDMNDLPDTFEALDGPLWQVHVARHTAGAHPQLNERYNVASEVFTVGRIATCSLVLDDPSISSVHLVLHRIGERLSAKVHARSGFTSINGREVALGEHVELDGATHALQLGDFQLALQPAPKTRQPLRKFHEPVEEITPLLRLSYVRATSETIVRIAGRVVPLPVPAQRLLQAVAKQPNLLVPYADIHRELDPSGRGGYGDVHNFANKVRKAFRDALDEAPEWANALEQRECVVSVEDAKFKNWGHRLLSTKSTVGMRLHLEPADILIETLD